MQKTLLFLFLALSLVFVPFSHAQEKCIGTCPSGTTLKGEFTCETPEDPRPLPIIGLTCKDPAYTPTSTRASDIDSCTCNLRDSSNTSGKGSQCQPGSSTVTTEGSGIMTAIGCVPTEPQVFVESVLRYGTLAAGGVAFLLMLLAAIQMITAEGNPNTIKTSQEKFYSAIIGLLLVVFSVLLMQVIGVDLLGLKGFGK